MQWVTRPNVNVDRVACPWLIRTLIDAQAEFNFVAPEKIADVVQSRGATAFDAPGVGLGHHGAECSFDAIV